VSSVFFIITDIEVRGKSLIAQGKDDSKKPLQPDRGKPWIDRH
jgi:hypothetical protein